MLLVKIYNSNNTILLIKIELLRLREHDINNLHQLEPHKHALITMLESTRTYPEKENLKIKFSLEK